tara:strand:- start:819 stop:1763 length:945 start_codon:yes stop_codon:yes gene_type:complete
MGDEFNFFDPSTYGNAASDLISNAANVYVKDLIGRKLSRTPTPSVGETTGAALDAYKTSYPDYADTMRTQSGLDLAKQLELLGQYGPQFTAQNLAQQQAFQPQFNKLQSDEAFKQLIRRLGADVTAMRGPGKALVDETEALKRQVDDPYYRTRDQAGNLTRDLLNQFVDPATGKFTGELSGGERAEVDRFLNRQQQTSGNLGGPQSLMNIVSKAQAFGQGAQSKRNALGQALGVATSFLPAAKSGFDPLQVALGRPAGQFNTQTFTQPNLATNTGNQASNFFNQAMTTGRQSAGFKANQPSSLDNFSTMQNLGW